MAKISDFATDKRAEVEGVWIDIHDGLRLLIARADNINFLTKLRELGKPHATSVRMGAMDMNLALELSKKAMAETVLLGWTNLQEEQDGELVDIPYSAQKAYELLDANTDFFNLVRDLSQDRANFQRASNEQALGN